MITSKQTKSLQLSELRRMRTCVVERLKIMQLDHMASSARGLGATVVRTLCFIFNCPDVHEWTDSMTSLSIVWKKTTLSICNKMFATLGNLLIFNLIKINYFTKITTFTLPITTALNPLYPSIHWSVNTPICPYWNRLENLSWMISESA